MVFIASTNSRHILSLPAAYIGVVLIWSTTPLAIAWSGQAAGFLFGVSSRMVLGVLLAVLFMLSLGARLIWHKKAILAYIYGGLGLYSSMMLVYWAAQLIPSGWIALLFGLTPIFSALMASLWLEDEPITPHRIVGMFTGLVGLFFVLKSSLTWHDSAIWGVLAVVLSGMLYSMSSVLVKRVNADIPATTMTAGSLLITAPLFLLTWLLVQPSWAETWWQIQHASLHSLLSILYLAVFGSVFGFSLYYFVLKHVDATRTALISLMTPVTSIFLGYYFNQEIVSMTIIVGTCFIVSGLAIFELGHVFK